MVLGSRRIGSRVWPLGVTWRHWSRDHWISRRPFPIGGPLEPSLYGFRHSQWLK